MKKRYVITVILAMILVYSSILRGVERNNTFTLSDGETIVKLEQIQPLSKTVKVSGDSDTAVIFTDVETGEQFIIEYITHGVTEKINLESGKWYKVKGRGNLTLSPVNVRIE